MSVVRVKHPADIMKLETALHLARRQTLERMASSEIAVESLPATERLLHRKMVELLNILHLCVKSTQEESSEAGDSSSTAEVEAVEKEAADLDARVQTLQQKVEEAAGRVAKLRGEVPAALSQHFRARLQACRPLARSAAPDAVAAQDGDAALPEALSPAPAELRGKLSDAATQLPILRAELEEKLARLQRIVGAMNAEEPAAEPGTVERAARGMATPGPAGGMASPRLAEAVSGGKIATRKRVLTNLARPVPYALRG